MCGLKLSIWKMKDHFLKTACRVGPTVPTAPLLTRRGLPPAGRAVEGSEAAPQFCRERVLRLIGDAWALSPWKCVVIDG